MASERNKKTFKKDIFLQSYNESVERITGSKQFMPFNVPPEILENRQQFWDEFFGKYIDQASDTTECNIVCKKEPVCKSLNVIQHWVNTGYLPYTKFRMDEDKQSDIGSLITAKCLSSSHSSCNISSSSSVDTAAYILSNMNTTNKAETMAIVEGAKDDTLTISQNMQSTKITEPTIDKVLESNNENIVLERNLDANVNKDILSNTVDKLTDDKLIDNNTLNYNKLIDERLMYSFNDSIKTNSYIKQNLLNMSLSHVTETSLSKENFISNSSIRKLGHHKKLYTSRDTPVDLIEMNSSSRNIISKLKQNLHPALDFGCKLSKKYKIFKKRRTKHFSIFSKDLMNIRQFNMSSHNKRKRKKSKSTLSESTTSLTDLKKSDDSLVTNNNINDRMTDQHLIKCNIDQYMNRSLPNSESTNKQDNLNKLLNHVDKIDIKKYKKSNEVISNFKNMNPVVYLTRLSKNDIERHKKSEILTKNRRKLNRVQLSRYNMLSQRHKKLKKATDLTNSNSTIHFDKFDIQEYKRPKSMVMLNLNPLVHLKRLSEFEILKYKRSVDMKKNHQILNAKVLVTRLSKFDIEKYTNVNNSKIISKSDILSTSIQVQDDTININDRFSTSNYSNASLSVINLANEDTTSNQSTLLMRKCDSTLFDNSSADNLSVFSKCSSQLYSSSTKANNDYILKTKERFNEKGKELDKIESMTDKSIVNTEEECNTRNSKFKKISRTDVLKADSENMSKSKNISLASPKTEIIYKNNSIYKNNNEKKPYTLHISDDDDDEFVKLLHCSKDMQELKLQQRYKEFYESFNSPIGKSKEVIEDIGKCNNTNSSILVNQTFPRPIVEGKEKDNENGTKSLSNTNIQPNRSRSFLSHVLYRTKLIDSDSESLSMSH